MIFIYMTIANPQIKMQNNAKTVKIYILLLTQNFKIIFCHILLKFFNKNLYDWELLFKSLLLYTRVNSPTYMDSTSGLINYDNNNNSGLTGCYVVMELVSSFSYPIHSFFHSESLDDWWSITLVTRVNRLQITINNYHHSRASRYLKFDDRAILFSTLPIYF